MPRAEDSRMPWGRPADEDEDRTTYAPPDPYPARLHASRTIAGTQNAVDLAAGLARASAWFTVEPLPDDRYRFTVKSDSARALDETPTVAVEDTGGGVPALVVRWGGRCYVYTEEAEAGHPWHVLGIYTAEAWDNTGDEPAAMICGDGCGAPLPCEKPLSPERTQS